MRPLILVVALALALACGRTNPVAPDPPALVSQDTQSAPVDQGQRIYLAQTERAYWWFGEVQLPESFNIVVRGNVVRFGPLPETTLSEWGHGLYSGRVGDARITLDNGRWRYDGTKGIAFGPYESLPPAN